MLKYLAQIFVNYYLDSLHLFKLLLKIHWNSCSINKVQQKMKIWSHSAEFESLAFSAVTANMLELD